MFVVADSGSTKTQWKVSNRSEMYVSEGLNPHYLSAEELQNLGQRIPLELLDCSKQVEDVFFYGAGCSAEVPISKIEQELGSIFTNAKIHVSHDLMGAAIACCGREPGIVNILGTGSSSAHFDGKNIVDQVPALGFYIGDNASAGQLGKLILQAYYFRELPKDLSDAFREQFGQSRAELLESVYASKTPNRVVGAFAPFLYEHKTHPYIHNLLVHKMDMHIRRHIMKYAHHRTLPIHFTGSVSFAFQSILNAVMLSYRLKPGVVIKNPLEKLMAYHSKDY